jgi:hypothetical protein
MGRPGARARVIEESGHSAAEVELEASAAK